MFTISSLVCLLSLGKRKMSNTSSFVLKPYNQPPELPKSAKFWSWKTYLSNGTSLKEQDDFLQDCLVWKRSLADVVGEKPDTPADREHKTQRTSTALMFAHKSQPRDTSLAQGSGLGEGELCLPPRSSLAAACATSEGQPCLAGWSFPYLGRCGGRTRFQPGRQADPTLNGCLQWEFTWRSRGSGCCLTSSR